MTSPDFGQKTLQYEHRVIDAIRERIEIGNQIVKDYLNEPREIPTVPGLALHGVVQVGAWAAGYAVPAVGEFVAILDGTYDAAEQLTNLGVALTDADVEALNRTLVDQFKRLADSVEKAVDGFNLHDLKTPKEIREAIVDAQLAKKGWEQVAKKVDGTAGIEPGLMQRVRFTDRRRDRANRDFGIESDRSSRRAASA